MKKTISGVAALAMSVAVFGGLNRAMAASTLSQNDKDYLKQATEEVLGEASLSRIADKHATSEPVKGFAHDMIKGSEKMEKELHEEADKFNYVLPNKDDWAKANDTRLHSLETNPDFDKAYLDEQIKDHQEMIKLWDKASDRTDLVELKKWFGDKSTALKANLQRAEDLRAKLK